MSDLTLTAFLLERIAEEVALARRIRPREYLTTRDDPALGTCDTGVYDAITVTSGRVLAECVARRGIIEAAANPRCDGALDGVLLVLASVYVNHPDYDERWRP